MKKICTSHLLFEKKLILNIYGLLWNGINIYATVSAWPKKKKSLYRIFWIENHLTSEFAIPLITC